MQLMEVEMSLESECESSLIEMRWRVVDGSSIDQELTTHYESREAGRREGDHGIGYRMG